MAWDIGADEYVSAAPSNYNVVFNIISLIIVALTAALENS